MELLLSMPGGAEWLLVLLFYGFVFIAPVLAIIYFFKNRELKKQMAAITKERDDLMSRLTI